MTETEREIYEFEGFRLDVSEHLLWQNGTIATVTPKAFDLLVLLVRNQGHLLAKDEIIERLWAGSFVEEANLNVNISALRRILGDTPTEQRFIETVPRHGYRFVAPVVSPGGKPIPDAAEVVDESSLSSDLAENPQAPLSPRKRRSLLVPLGALAGLILMLFVGWFAYRLSGSQAPKPRSVAVLPFRPLSQGSSDEALEMGMTDALITKLSKLDQLTVRPTSAVRRFAAQDTDAVAAGRELQVEAVLDGKIQKADKKVRVTVQLIRVADGGTLWSDTFDDYFSNIFALQDSISERMANLLAIKLGPREQESLEKRYTESTEAYQLYLQGAHHHLQISPEGSRKAIEYYEQAVKVDPRYALAWAESVGAYAHVAGLNENREANLQRARIAAYTALSLDPELPEAHEAVATILDFFDWNWPEAEREYLKAIELGPNRESPHYAYSIFLSRFKRHDEAVREIRIARQIHPNAVYVQNQLVQTLFRARRFEECIAEANRSLELKPDSVTPIGFIFRSYLQLSKIAEAEAAMGRLIELDPANAPSFRARLYLKLGKTAEADALLRPMVREFSEKEIAWSLAQTHMRLGEFDKMFQLLEYSFKRREPPLTTINIEPEWDSIRGDPRYTDLMRRIGLPP